MTGNAQNQTLGMLAMLGSCLAFAALDALAKSVSDTMPGFQIAFFRVAFSWPFIAAMIWGQWLQSVRSDKVPLHAIRAAIQSGSMLLFFSGLATTPLAQVVAIEFSSPLIAVALAAAFLGDALPWRRILALLAGVAGLLIAVRPGIVEVGPGPLMVIASAGFWAATILVVRMLGRTESSTAQVFYVALFLTPVNGLAALTVWQTPAWSDLGVMLIAAGMGTLALWLYGEALRLADLTAVLPLDFTKILWASLFGWLFFAETPDALTLVGGAVIFAAAIALTWAERKAERTAPTSID
jgi:drug/metabolite transporter (DMT)-like permease